ncbi:hypothetical protein VN12_08855 [Pirellula sp. SH-Sr6A]|uniref:hypothetical protein n=1 Tax=Pirellula sp. SH-Sr6A TaxID=1632865 RepID=UPI00078B1817|nr:hypothetical protein [Pirellula sp. SH-Sr6A]AMV32219.1 hypothetical protein VN12_08855 [Pirellula sp. SH-Sr6A]
MMKLADALPEFAEELAQGLAAEGYKHLAETVHSVEIVERCLCDEPGCVTFYAVPKSSAPAWPACKRVIAPAKGVMCVHYSKRQILWVEVLGRPDDRAKLDQIYILSDSAGNSANQAVNGSRRQREF